ncbi:MAG TPA: hypothetical protein PKY59_09945 [Pyrinomonadaceae bacterium]|nr:hypothetical protein [Pyrinomonadaceae bacterium]
MNNKIEKIADAILYEGYALFPYRKNALKNQKRFNFGVLSPKCWAKLQTNEQFFQQTEILFTANENAKVTFRFRYLQLEDTQDWQTAHEKVIENSVELKQKPKRERGRNDELSYLEFSALAHAWASVLEAKIELKTEKMNENLFKLSFKIENLSENSSIENLSREEILQFSFVSAHTIFEIENGEFISVIEPPEEFQKYSQTLENINCFPVLVGDEKRNSMLSAPIILYDFPQAAENSFDNFFDGLEIDELMVMNLLALTDKEKEEIKNTDAKTRKILEKIENANAEDLLKLHAKMSFR